jgi:CMP/dCMP kinase
VSSGANLDTIVVAMDGTAGSGKSSASRGVATALGLRYLDTGAMYRAMTWQMLLDGVDVQDADAVARRAETVVIESGTDPRRPTIRLGGSDVSREIRSGEVNATVSPVSAVPRVRELLVDQQRRIIGAGGVVVEGRDIGTVVAPDAAVKVFLTADAAERARRRAAELGVDPEIVLRDQTLRDEQDRNRAHSPLQAAPGAIEVDTTGLSIDQVVEKISVLVDEAR